MEEHPQDVPESEAGAEDSAPARSLLFCAGDLSGDIHAARLAREVLSRHPDWAIHALGGSHLKQAGAKLFRDTGGYSVMGFTSAMMIVPKMLVLQKQLLRFIKQTKLDAIVMVDWGAFNTRLAKEIKGSGIPILYYFPPRSWQKTGDGGLGIVPLVKRVATPFEWSAQRLQQAGGNAEWVGHPLLEIVDEAGKQFSREVIRAQLNVAADETLITILPGSREMELKILSPRLADAAQKLSEVRPGCRFVVAVAKGAATRVRKYFPAEFRIVENRSAHMLLACDAAWVKSGTATLEAAVCGAPQIVLYDVPALLHLQIKLTGLEKKVPMVAMPNIILGEKKIPEMLGRDCNPASLCEEMRKLLESQELRDAQCQAYERVRAALGSQLPYTASERTADILEEMISGANAAA